MEDDNLQTWREPFITCPYCGYVDHDSWEWADTRGDCEYDCPQCEKTCILLEPEREIYYTTKKLESCVKLNENHA